jgi:hypothetical protein
VDIFTVKRSQEGLIETQGDVVRNPISYMLNFLDSLDLLLDGRVVLHQLLEQTAALNDVVGRLFK